MRRDMKENQRKEGRMEAKEGRKEKIISKEMKEGRKKTNI